MFAFDWAKEKATEAVIDATIHLIQLLEASGTDMKSLCERKVDDETIFPLLETIPNGSIIAEELIDAYNRAIKRQ